MRYCKMTTIFKFVQIEFLNYFFLQIVEKYLNTNKYTICLNSRDRIGCILPLSTGSQNKHEHHIYLCQYQRE